MRKQFCLILTLLMLAALCACGRAPSVPKEPETAAAGVEDTSEEEPIAAQTAPDGPETAPDAEEDYYKPVTAMNRDAVESFCAQMRSAYLDEDWESLADFARWPIMVDGTEVKDAEAFAAYMQGRTVSESDRAELEKETCRDMFFNGAGICLGAGEIWLTDPNYMTDAQPELAIIALNGIVER